MSISRKFALIIGNSKYTDDCLSQLQAPRTDVDSLSRVLGDPTIGNFESIVKLVDEPLSIVQKEIARFYRHKRRNALLLFYFSGHGVLDARGRLYLAVTDTEHDLLSGTALPARFVRDEIADCFARNQVAILDCCHSGAFDRSKMAIGSSVGTRAIFESSGHVVLTATDALQVALDSDSMGDVTTPSVFTRYLIEGLETGLADLDGDGFVTVDELYDFTYSKVITDETTSQTPMKIGKQKGQLILALNPFAAGQQEPSLDRQEHRSYEILRTAYEDWITFDKQDHRLMNEGSVDLVLEYLSEPVLPIHLLEYLMCSIANLQRTPAGRVGRLKGWFSKVESSTVEDLTHRLLCNQNSRIRERTAALVSALGLRDAIIPLMSVIENDTDQKVKIEGIKAIYRLGDRIPDNLTGFLIDGQNNWIVKSLALQSNKEMESCLLIGDGSSFADELGVLAKRAGFQVIATPDAFATIEIPQYGSYDFLQPFTLVILVRGEHFLSIGDDNFYTALLEYVMKGGNLFATSWVSWETRHSEDRQTYFAEVLPFLHGKYPTYYGQDFVEDTLVNCRPTHHDLARTFFPESLSFLSSFEPLEAKENSTVLLETDEGIPIFGFRQFRDGMCYYLNTCQHSCTGYMPSPLQSSPELGIGLERFFEWFRESRRR